MTAVPIQLLYGFLVGGALALWPGNTLTMTIREASRRGALAGVGAASGRTAADLLAVLAIGITSLRAPGFFAGEGALPAVFGVLAGVVLALYGWRLMEGHAGGALRRERGDGMILAWHRQQFLDRLLASFSSPLWHVFWWTAGLRLVAEAATAGGGAGVAVFGAGFAAGGLGWHGFVALRLRAPRRERALRDRPYRILTSLGGLGLVGLGAKVATGAVAGSALPDALTRIVAAVFV